MVGWHKAIKNRIVATGDTSPGQWNFVADILAIATAEADGWTNRYDDARRIPDVLDEGSKFCRGMAKEA